MPPTPLNSAPKVPRSVNSQCLETVASTSRDANANAQLRGEEAFTQTEDLDESFASSADQMWSAADSALDEDSDGSESVMERLSRRMGSLFSYDRQDRGTQTAKDPLTLETEKLAFDIVFFVLGRRPSKASDETTQCLRQSVVKMLDKHSIVFNGMVTRLSIDRDCDLHAGFQELSNELFTNNEVSWGKIIALFAFGARLAQHCEESNLSSLVYDVASNLSQYAVEKLTPFLKDHGGWTTLCDAFPIESDYETKIWQSLVVTGLGLTILATFLAMHH